MRLSFLVPLLGLALGPRTIVSNTITVAEVEEVTDATDAGDGDIGMWPGTLRERGIDRATTFRTAQSHDRRF